MASIRSLLPSGHREPDEAVARQTVGNALVLYRNEISRDVQTLAMTVVADPDNDVVILDLHHELPVSAWESVANAVPRHRRRGIRLLASGGQRGVPAMIGQWLAQRLGRSVIAPDGDLLRGSAGMLFVCSRPDSGWVRFRPGRPPTWESKRYPAPAWDSSASEYRTSSSTAGIEPLPSGVWIHDLHSSGIIEQNRRRLVTHVPCQPEIMTVLLGCPGTPPLALDDVARFWRGLSPTDRQRIRFVQYGAIRLPDGDSFGQALADVLSAPVVCYTGIPLGDPATFQIRTMSSAGVPGWPPFALELGYQPRPEPLARASRPTIVSHRKPLGPADEISPRVYWYAPDAVVEIVQSGLWVRPADEPSTAERVRSTPVDPDSAALVFEDVVASRSGRMRELAEDLAGQIDRPTAVASRLRPASTVNGPALPGQAEGSLASLLTTPGDDQADQGTAPMSAPPPVAGGNLPPGITSVALTPDVDVPGNDVATPGSSPAETAPAAPVTGAPDTAASPWAPPSVPTPELPAGQPAAPDAQPAGPTDSVPPAPSLGKPPSPAADTPTTALRPLTGESGGQPGPPPPPVEPGAQPESPTPPVEPGDQPGPPSPPVEPGGQAEGPAGPVGPPATAARPTIARPQPVPGAKATALTPNRGLDTERAWLRRSLSRDFDTLASSVSRIMSEHPGMNAGAGGSADDVLVDSVAVRLYLGWRGAGIDAGLRSGRNGPHVPFARCTVSGLSRLPSFRGAALLRADLNDSEWAFYRDRRLITNWSFVNMLTAPCATQRGDTDVLIWSMTARRTELLEPDGDERVDQRVVFLPGTNFKVLSVEEAGPERRGAVLLREIGSNEIDDDGNVDPNREALDELAVKSMRRSLERWAGDREAHRVGSASAARFSVLPGLTGPEREKPEQEKPEQEKPEQEKEVALP